MSNRRKLKKRRRLDGPIHGRIASLRKDAKLSQQELAEQLGVDGTAVSHWENGFSRPDIGRLGALAEALGVSVETLIEGEEAAA